MSALRHMAAAVARPPPALAMLGRVLSLVEKETWTQYSAYSRIARTSSVGRLRDLRSMRAWQMEAYVGVKGGWSCDVVGHESELRMRLMPGII